MRKTKGFVARVLAAAMIITSVLPMGTLTASAKPTVKTAKDQVQWMYADADGDITIDPSHWLDSKTGNVFDGFGGKELVGEAMLSWKFNALESDGDQHKDLTAPTAATTIYASKIGIKATDSRRVMQFDVTKLTDAGTQFGIMLRYVDATHWVYLGHSSTHWYIEWKNGENTSYSDAPKYDADAETVKTEVGTTDRTSWVNGAWPEYTNGANQTLKWAPAFYPIKIEQNKYYRIQIIYENLTDIKISMTELEKKTENGKMFLEEKAGTTKSEVLSFKVFETIRNYADDKDEDIYFGFIGDKRSGTAVKVNFLNVKKGALKAVSNQASTNGGDDWVEPLTNVTFEDCGWKSIKTSDDEVETIIREQVIGEGVTYASIGDPNNDEKKSPNATIFNNTVTDFAEGTIAADLRPYDIGNDKEFYLGVTAVTGVSPQTAVEDQNFKVGIQGDKWVYSVNGSDAQEITGVNLPEIKVDTDYNLSITIDEDHKATAKVTTVAGVKSNAGEAGNNEEDETTTQGDEPAATPQTYVLIGGDGVDVGALSGSVSLTAKNEVLRVKHVTCDQIVYVKTPLEEAYDEIIEANKNNEFYTDVWGLTLQGALEEANTKLLSNDTKFVLSPQDPAYTGQFDETAAEALRDKFTEINKIENTVEKGKGDLEAALDLEITPGSPNADRWYTEGSLATYKTAWDAGKDYLEKTLNNLGEGFQGVTKTEVEGKITAIEGAFNDLAEKPADAAYLTANLDPAISAAAPTDITDMEDTANTDYYNNWDAFKAAYDAAKALKDQEGTPTLKAVDEAIAKLAEETAKRTAKTVGSVTEYTNQINDLIAGVLEADYYKEGYDAYTTALGNARKIKTGDTVKSAADLIKALEAAVEGLDPKTLADDAAAATTMKGEVDAIKAEVGGKEYVDDANWTAYQQALTKVEALLADSNSTKAEVEEALKELREAKADLTEKQKQNDDKVTTGTTPALKAGQTADVSGNQYTVADANAKTVTLTKSQLDKKKTKKLTIPATVSVNGISCTVVGIGKDAFKGYNQLASVVIPETVTKIEANAFSGCKKLKKVQIKNANINIAKKAFKGAPSKATVKVPKALKKNAKAKKKFQTMLKKAGLKNAKIK